MKWLCFVICTFALIATGSLPAAADDRWDGKGWRGGPPSASPVRHKVKRHPNYEQKHVSKHFSKNSVHIYHYQRPGGRHWKVPHQVWTVRQEDDDALIGGLIGGALGAFFGNAVYAVSESGTLSGGAGQDCDVGGAGRYCREFISEARVAGRVEQLYGVACWQPDGSWEVVSVCGR